MLNKIIPALLLPTLLAAIEFHHLSMEEAIELALERNPSIKISAERVNDARQSVNQALGAA